jgi:hypothetical protein
MTRLRMRRLIEASPEAVWDELSHLDRHVTWMADAESIEFVGPKRRGVGTVFDCATKVGPLRLRDRMEVTRWTDRRELGVRHVGLVSGEGVFSLRPDGGGHRTQLDWTERLRFPWYLGGPITGLLAKPILRHIWRGNLRRLAARITPG